MREDQGPVLEALRSSKAYPHPTREIHTAETHISWVFLTGHVAYKIKKAVRLPYLDFSTLELRERACRDEVALNRRLAPTLYHRVVGIGGDPAALRIGGSPVVEFAVEMTQFPSGALADELIRSGSLSADEVAGLAETIAGFHATLAPFAATAPGERILANLEELESDLRGRPSRRLGAIGGWIRAALARLASALADRGEDGFIRECHGDLHLGNIVRFGGRLIPFDCLEFSRELRTIDVIDEVAFLFMDLAAHARSDLAYRFLNRYLEMTGDYVGLRLLSLYAAHRALVRAKVALAATHDAKSASRAAAYLDAAAGHALKPMPFCLITVGYSGSGKTTIARRLAPALPAVHVRSDVERKRLYGLAADARTGSSVGQGIYGPDSTEATYERLAAAADAALSGGISVIVDASFLDRDRRDRFRRLAGRRGARFVIVHCTADADALRARIAARKRESTDASEADLAVLEHQLATAAGLGDSEQGFVHVLDTQNELDADQLARAIRAGDDQSSSSTSY